MILHFSKICCLLVACATTCLAQSPRIRAIGTVQDGGLPHAGCTCDRCTAARSDPARKRYVASLALIIPDGKGARGRDSIYLVDATPDIREQLHHLEDVRKAPAGRVDRAPVDGVLLTHAHIGHYLGLAHFGFEAVSTTDLPVYCTPCMAAFLRENGPWSQLVTKRNIVIHESPADTTFTLGKQITVTPIAVPHRDEYSDTVAFRIDGPNRTVLYMPDTSPWQRWQSPVLDLLTDPDHHLDTLIVDGTFFSADELPGRDVSKIGHPLMTDTMDLLQPMVDAGTLQVYFTHLNHSNPALEPGSDVAHSIAQRGFAVLSQGDEFGL